MILNGRADSQYKQRQMDTHRDKRTRTRKQPFCCLPRELLYHVCSFYLYAEDGWTRPRGRGEAYGDIRDNRRHARRTARWLLDRHTYSTMRLVHREWSTLFPKDLTCFLTCEVFGEQRVGLNVVRVMRERLRLRLVENITCLVVDEWFLTAETASIVARLAKNVQFMKVECSFEPPWYYKEEWWPRAICTLSKYTQLRELALPEELTMTSDMFNAVAQLTSLTHLKTPPCEADPGTKTDDNGLSVIVAQLPKLVFLELTHLVSPFVMPAPGLPHLKRLVVWIRAYVFDAGIKYLGPYLPSLEQLTLRGLRGFESEIDQLKGIRTLPKKTGVFIDLHVSMDWFPTSSEFRQVSSSWYEIYVEPLYETSEHTTHTRVVIKHVDDTLHLWTARGTITPADKKKHQRVLRFA